MKKSKNHLRFGILSLLVLLVALSRLIPHPPNFAPIGAMALFGATYLKQKHFVLIIPIASMWLSDLALNNIVYAQYFDHFVWFYPGCYWTYGAFIVIGFIGFGLLKKIKIQNILLASCLASISFFILSNFGVWLSGIMYPKTFTGLMMSYTAGLPFLKNTFMGDLVYSGLLFGVFELAKYRFPILQFQTNQYK
ncbi:MAG: hypothetical protein IMY72_07810 [Bacteroidetes bacterium]|nr:hypothetical protein [Bacteroidota bacterium]